MDTIEHRLLLAIIQDVVWHPALATGSSVKFLVFVNEKTSLNVLRARALCHRQVARHLFDWGKHSGQFAGWSKCGPTPDSIWPAPVSRQRSSQSSYSAGGSNPPGQGVRTVTSEVHTVPEARTVVHPPVMVAPMVR